MSRTNVGRAVSFPCLLALAALSSAAAADPEKVDLSRGARIFASHATPTPEFQATNAIDGDPETKWVGEAHPLSFQPTNIVLEFEKPLVLARIAIVSEVFRDRLALKDFEVYAWTGRSWAGGTPIAVVKGTKDLRTVVDFAPVRSTRLRIRIRDTWREDHTYPRIHEIEVYAAPPGAEPREMKDSPLTDEKKSERMLLERAMGLAPIYPGEEYDPAKGYLGYARAFLDTMIAEGTDSYGPVKSPQFASILDMETHRIPEDTPANIPGQRYGDRSLHGGNLFHDVMVLGAADAVTALTGDGKYRKAATDYLRFFLERCPQPTGLFPWGEHAHWDFFKEAPGHPVHEYLGGVPTSFWERLWEIDPKAVRGEGDGLLNHVVGLETFDFDRHADIDRPLPVPRPRMGFMDFPRHGGFYIALWTFLHQKTGEAKYLDWSMKMVERFRARTGPCGLPPSTSGAKTASAESALSLSVSLLESARLLAPGEARERFEGAARSWLDAVLRLPHRPAEGRFLSSLPLDADPARAEGEYGDPYRCEYGGGFSADDAALLLAAHRLTGDRRALDLGAAFADFYRRNDPPPPSEIVRAHVYASLIGLFADLYSLRGKPEDLEQAERHAKLAIGRLFHRGLFRGATGIDHYEGDMMVGNLAYNLVWLHSIASRTGVKVEPNHFNR